MIYNEMSHFFWMSERSALLHRRSLGQKFNLFLWFFFSFLSNWWKLIHRVVCSPHRREKKTASPSNNLEIAKNKLKRMLNSNYNNNNKLNISQEVHEL